MAMPDTTKIDESRKTAVFWARALKEMDVPFAIKLFGGEFMSLKDFNQDYDDPSQRIKPRLLQLTNASMGGTNISDPLKASCDEMLILKRKYPDSFGAIFVISDGGANQGLVKDELTHLIDQIKKKFIVTNFALSQDQREIREAIGYFGERNVVAPASFKQLHGEAIRVLRTTLQDAFRLSGGIRY
jgi:hypothetical protein